MEQKRCISSLTLAELSAELKALGQPGFRAKQIFHWVHQKLVTEFSAMTLTSCEIVLSVSAGLIESHSQYR